MNLSEHEGTGNHPNIRYSLYSILGTREYQQDYASVVMEDHCFMAVLCDGMGGLNGGEKASSLAAERMILDFKNRDRSEPIYQFLTREAVLLDREVASLKDGSGKPLGAGTTLVAAVVEGNQLYWISVGDSKIYAIRDRKIQSLAREHNYRLSLTDALKTGKIDREQFDKEEKSKRADALISFIGIGELSLIDIGRAPIRLEPEDIILLCSDGVCKSLTEDQIQFMITDNAFDLMIAAERLVDTAMECSGRSQDNTTAVVLAYK